MRFLEWTSDLDTGIKAIDDQHKQIVEYINALHDAQQQHDKSNTGIIIGQLVDYTPYSTLPTKKRCWKVPAIR